MAPTSPNDPNGTVEFYCIAFLFLGAAIGATVLGRLIGPVRGLRGALARLGLVSLYAALLSLVVTFFADVVLRRPGGALRAPFPHPVAVRRGGVPGRHGAFGAGGAAASIVLILVLIALGNPSSGGPVPRPLLNGFYSGLNPVLPQGAALSALRGVQYFGDQGIALALLCLLIWALAGLALVAPRYSGMASELRHPRA